MGDFPLHPQLSEDKKSEKLSKLSLGGAYRCTCTRIHQRRIDCRSCIYPGIPGDHTRNLRVQHTGSRHVSLYVDNHGILGITGSTVSTEAVQIYGIPQGVFVSEVTEGGPADDAGITKNMVITEFDGKTITSIDQLVELLQYYEPKEKIDVTVAVLDGNEYKEKTLTVKLGKDDSSSKDSKDSSDESAAQDSQDSQDADIPDIQGGQDDSDQGDADAFADDGEASLFRDFEQNGLHD